MASSESVQDIAQALRNATSGGVLRFDTNPTPFARVTIPGTAAATAANYGYFYVADRPLIVTGVTERHETAGSDGGAVTLQVAKVPSGTAKGSGTNLLTAGVNLKGTADTNQSGTLAATAAITLAVGDALTLVPTGTLTAVAGVHVTVSLRAL